MQLLTSYVINQNLRYGNGHNGNIGSNTDNKWKAATGGIAITNVLSNDTTNGVVSTTNPQ
jgi:hypothetical protein